MKIGQRMHGMYFIPRFNAGGLCLTVERYPILGNVWTRLHLPTRNIYENW